MRRCFSSVLKKCFASGSEEFHCQGRQQDVSESGDSLEFCEPDSSKPESSRPWVGAKALLQGQMTFSTGCQWACLRQRSSSMRAALCEALRSCSGRVISLRRITIARRSSIDCNRLMASAAIGRVDV